MVFVDGKAIYLPYFGPGLGNISMGDVMCEEVRRVFWPVNIPNSLTVDTTRMQLSHVWNKVWVYKQLTEYFTSYTRRAVTFS